MQDAGATATPTPRVGGSTTGSGRPSAGSLDAGLARAHVEWLARLPIQECPLAPLLEAAWRRRHNLWIVDAFYVELAVQRGMNLVTCDAAMAAAAGELGEFVAALER